MRKSALKLACDKLAAGIPLNREEYSLILGALNEEYKFRREEWQRDIEDEFKLIGDLQIQ